MTFDVCDRIKRLTGLNAERVLAVAEKSAALSNDSVWRLLRAGAADIIAWDSSVSPGSEVAARLIRWSQIDQLVASPLVRENLVGRSVAWQAILRQIVEIGRFSDASILISGESGTGKELAARLIHTLDQRTNKGELVVLDCTTIVPELAGSEFFGHERGAFTGASTAREGAFSLADGGTLFLDEVGDLPRNLQAQLLRVIQEHTYKRVGGNVWQKTQFRLVCATNKNLPEEVKRGAFRADLYYRISDWTFTLPPLRERVEDIPLLARHFIHASTVRQVDLHPAVDEYLVAREYPGNIRELKQVIGRMMHRHVGTGEITVGDIPPEDRAVAGRAERSWSDGPLELAVRQALVSKVGLKEIGRIAENTAVRIALTEEAGNVQRAAQKLKVTDRALQLRQANDRTRNGDGEMEI